MSSKWATLRAWAIWIYPSDRIGGPPPAQRPPSRKTRAQLITAQVDAALLRQTQTTPPPDKDTYDRPHPEPQNLDIEALWSAPLPPASTDLNTGAIAVQSLHMDLGPEWCNCGHMAGAHRHDVTPELSIGGFLPPSPSGGWASSSDPSNPN